jgi:hypothetical protein
MDLLEHSGVLSTFYAQQALLPTGRYGIVFLANAYSGLVDFTGCEAGGSDERVGRGGPRSGRPARSPRRP